MNCLIDKKANISECIGIDHETACRNRFGMSLSEFIKSGVRVCDKERFETMAIEHQKPLTTKQKRIINRFLKDNDYYCVTDNFNTKYRIDRPIRRIK